MERESFEDEATAAILNKNFIAIKVDREERPELDSFYMAAVQSMTGKGGWPLSVFLTPDLKPFYGGTYFPPEPKYGMPSFKQVLEFVATIWKERRGATTENAGQIMEALRQRYQMKSEVELSPGFLEAGYATLVSSFDEEHGGFGGAPKFPLPLYLAFLLRYHFRTKKELALRTVVKTLDEIGRGDPGPRRRRVPQVLDRPAVARSPLREDALRQCPAREDVPGGIPGDQGPLPGIDGRGLTFVDDDRAAEPRWGVLLCTGRRHGGGRRNILHLDPGWKPSFLLIPCQMRF